MKVLLRSRAKVKHAPQPAPPSLPDPKYLEIPGLCKIEYVDVQPAELSPMNIDTPVTVVMVHGAPGSFRDFRYLIPLLAQQLSVRIVAINLPGYLGSVVEKHHYLDTVVALRTAEVAFEAIQKICGGQGNIFLIGHSFGAHAVINIATLNAKASHTGNDSADNVTALQIRGIALLTPAGCTPQRILRTNATTLLIKLLRSHNVVAIHVGTRLVRNLYIKVLGFPRRTPTGSCVSAVIRAGTTNFGVIRNQVKLLKSIQMPTFIAWALDDELIEPKIPEELGKLSHVGPRLEFARGGHNLQKTRVEQVSAALTSWMLAILSECGANELGMTQHLP